MEIIVTRHAVEQYQTKMFASISSTEITKILKNVVLKGYVTGTRPGNAICMEHNGIRVVVSKKGNIATVITCLGNKAYSSWFQKKEIRPRYRKAVV